MPPRLAFLTALLLLPAGCQPPAPRSCPIAAGAAAIYVVDRGWHTELGIPASLVTGPLATSGILAPGARFLMAGYGKRTFMTARTDRASEYLLGPFPGPAVIELFGLSVPPPQAYGAPGVITLPVTPSGAAQLSAFIWADLAKDRQGHPRLVGPGFFPGSAFYAANSQYNLGHTCNRWAADALAVAGARIEPAGVVFAGQVMARASCR